MTPSYPILGCKRSLLESKGKSHICLCVCVHKQQYFLNWKGINLIIPISRINLAYLGTLHSLTLMHNILFMPSPNSAVHTILPLQLDV